MVIYTLQLCLYITSHTYVHITITLLYAFSAVHYCRLPVSTFIQFLPIPELIPFRLTPQIRNLLRPHSEGGQLRSCMVHSLRALRNSPDLLLCTMDIFVREPTLDWKVCVVSIAAGFKCVCSDRAIATRLECVCTYVVIVECVYVCTCM